MAQHTVISQCIADTYIDDSTPNANYGNSNILRLNSTKTFWNIIFMKFAQANIPERKRIISVILYLYLTEPFNALNDRLFSIVKPYRNCSPERWENWEYEITANKFSNTTTEFGGTILAEISNKWLASGNYRAFELRTYSMPPYVISLDGATIAFHSRENTNPPYIEIVYEDVPPSAPTPKSPIGIYKDSRSVIRFEWQYNSDVGGTQKAFDLQWSTDQVNWTTVSQTTANNYYDMPADTLPAGNIYWRVRTYNEYDEVGPYSDIQSFYAIGAPAAPVLNAIPTNTARPVVSWSAFSQQVYQLQVLSGDIVVYDSGIVPGISIRQHKIKAWLEDGEYTVQLRIKDEYDMWSEWSSAVVTISTDKPEKPSITLQRSAYGVEITGTGLVYRSDYDKDEYICIGMADGSYFDNAVRSKVEYKYFIRAVSENDTFEDSDIKFIQAEFQYALIAPVSDLTNIFAFTRSLNAPPKRTYNRQPGGAFVEYAGRKYPVWEPTEHVNAAWQMAFYLKTWAEVEAFIALVDRKETVLYRDARGRKIYGILSNLTINDERSGYIVGFTLTEVDYIEGVDV